MIIVIEGVDGGGKSTLAAALSDRLNVPVFKSPSAPLKGGPLLQFSDLLGLTMAQLTGADVIYDRFVASEFVYDTAYGRTFDEEMVFDTDKMLALADHLCVRIKFGALQEWRTRQLDADIEASMFDRLEQLYDEFQALSRCTWLTMDAATPAGEMIECVTAWLAEHRPTKDRTFMTMATVAAKRSTCLARRNGAVLVSRDGFVVSTGYNGAPIGCSHPTECPRLRAGAASGASLDLCHDVHAEQNALLQAGDRARGGRLYTLVSPCIHCAKMIVNAGVAEVVYARMYGDQSGVQLLADAGIPSAEIGG